MSRVYEVSFDSFNETRKFQQLLFEKDIVWEIYSRRIVHSYRFFIAIKDKRIYNCNVFGKDSIDARFCKKKIN